MTLIPIIALAVTVICMVTAALLEGPSGRGVLYTIFAAKAIKEGAAGVLKYLILGIIEVLICCTGAILAVVMFIAGMGV